MVASFLGLMNTGYLIFYIGVVWSWGFFACWFFFFYRKEVVIDVSEMVDSVQQISCVCGDACEYTFW